MMRNIWVLLAMVAVLGGCNKDTVSMNEQRAGLRAAGDATVTVAMEELKMTDEAQRQKIADCAKQIDTFLNTGNVSDLTQGELRAEIEKLIPKDLRPYFNAILEVASSIHVDVPGKIGEDNVKRLKASIFGIETGVAQFKNSDMRPEAPPAQ